MLKIEDQARIGKDVCVGNDGEEDREFHGGNKAACLMQHANRSALHLPDYLMPEPSGFAG